MNSSHLLAITFLLATPHMYAMEMDTQNEEERSPQLLPIELLEGGHDWMDGESILGWHWNEPKDISLYEDLVAKSKSNKVGIYKGNLLIAEFESEQCLDELEYLKKRGILRTRHVTVRQAFDQYGPSSFGTKCIKVQRWDLAAVLKAYPPAQRKREEQGKDKENSDE